MKLLTQSKEFLKTPKARNVFLFGVVNTLFISSLCAYFSKAAVKNAKSYYADGGNMSVSLPDEFQDEFIDKTIRNRKAKSTSKKGKPKDDDVVTINTMS